MWRRRFVLFAPTGLTWRVGWNRAPARKITACCARLFRKSGARSANRIFARERDSERDEHDSTIADDRGGALWPLRRALRSGNAHGAAIRTRARVRAGEIGRLFPKAISVLAEKLRGATHAAAIRLAPD